MTVPALGSTSKPQVEKLKVGKGTDTLGIGNAHGLLYAFRSLYVMVNARVKPNSGMRGSGLYRLQDLDGDDQFDKITLLKEFKGDGEHGPHSIILSPDKKSIFLISGNHTDVPPMDAYRLPNNWQEDNIFPLIKIRADMRMTAMHRVDGSPILIPKARNGNLLARDIAMLLTSLSTKREIFLYMTRIWNGTLVYLGIVLPVFAMQPVEVSLVGELEIANGRLPTQIICHLF